MVNITEKIKEIEDEMKRTQKNKATGPRHIVIRLMYLLLIKRRIPSGSVEGKVSTFTSATIRTRPRSWWPRRNRF